jgi:hypothetical protein
MVALYEISIPDMGFDYFPDPPSDIHCPKCKCRIKEWNRPYRSREKKLKHDFQVTYDGVRVVSESAKNFLMENASTPLTFEKFFTNAYRMECESTLKMDVNRFPVRRGEVCPLCGEPKYQLRRTKFRFYNYNDIDADGAYFTDLYFGNVDRKGPLFMVGHDLGVALTATFPEIYLRDVDHTTD